MDRMMAVFAFAVFAGFLGILAYFVPSVDLLAVLGLTVALAAYDVYEAHWRR